MEAPAAPPGRSRRRSLHVRSVSEPVPAPDAGGVHPSWLAAAAAAASPPPPSPEASRRRPRLQVVVADGAGGESPGAPTAVGLEASRSAASRPSQLPLPSSGSPSHRRRPSRISRLLDGGGRGGLTSETRKRGDSRFSISLSRKPAALDGEADGDASGAIAPYVPAPRPLRTTNHVLSFREEGTLADIPPAVAACSRALLATSVAVAVYNGLLELLSEVGAVPGLEFRFNFIVLTMVMVMLGYQSFSGIKKRERDVMLDVSSVMVLNALGMLCSDIYFVAVQGSEGMRARAAAYRLPVMLASFGEMMVVLYMLVHLRLLPMLRSRPLALSPSFYPRIDLTRRLSDVGKNDEEARAAVAAGAAGAGAAAAAGAVGVKTPGPPTPAAAPAAAARPAGEVELAAVAPSSPSPPASPVASPRQLLPVSSAAHASSSAPCSPREEAPPPRQGQDPGVERSPSATASRRAEYDRTPSVTAEPRLPQE